MTPAMVEAVQRLAVGPAIAARRVHADCEHFKTPDGRSIPLQTLRGLSRRGLARQLLSPSRFFLTTTGRRLAADLTA